MLSTTARDCGGIEDRRYSVTPVSSGFTDSSKVKQSQAEWPSRLKNILVGVFSPLTIRPFPYVASIHRFIGSVDSNDPRENTDSIRLPPLSATDS